MNCHVCGTPLLQEATYCLRCGAATLAYASTTGGAADDPTVASPPYGGGSPPADNPYGPSSAAPLAPPPPSSHRGGRLLWIMIAALALVLLIGGGGLAWFEYAVASHGGAVAAVTTTTAPPQATASPSAAPQPFAAKGTATGVSSTTTQVVQDGSNKISRITEQWEIDGDVMGSFTVEETAILHPDKTGTSSGAVTCICTVAGKSGTLMWSFTDTGTADGSYQGQFFDFHGTGDLAKLHGQGTFQGQGSQATYAMELYFDS
jgi:hypothetical protein